MQTKIIEATNGSNWGKFLLGRHDKEWARRAQLDEDRPLLRACGWWSPKVLWVLDLQTGEGALFIPGGLARADLNKHQIWVCPLYEHFLVWLYRQDLTDLANLPDTVELPDAPFELYGYRRPGPVNHQRRRRLSSRSPRALPPRRFRMRRLSSVPF